MRRAIAQSERAYTLIEMLATLVMVAIILPVLIQGITMSTSTSAVAIDRLQATALAESKLSELLATNTWNEPDLEGEFTTDQILAAGGQPVSKDPNVEQTSATLTGSAAPSNSNGDSPTSSAGSADPSRFRWSAELKDWQDSRVQELAVTVTWESRGEEHSLSLSTLVQAQQQ